MEIPIEKSNEKQTITEPVKWAEEPKWRTERTPITEQGWRVVGEVVGIRNTCRWGHKVGDKLDLSVFANGPKFAGSGTAEYLCGCLYHAVYPDISWLQWGGKVPAWWHDVGQTGEHLFTTCPDTYNCVYLKLSREPKEPRKDE
jgi:uncharacterized repeat protein (TIGR04076 family)